MPPSVVGVDGEASTLARSPGHDISYQAMICSTFYQAKFFVLNNFFAGAEAKIFCFDYSVTDMDAYSFYAATTKR